MYVYFDMLERELKDGYHINSQPFFFPTKLFTLWGIILKKKNTSLQNMLKSQALGLWSSVNFKPW